MSDIRIWLIIATCISVKRLHFSNATKMEPFVVNGAFAQIITFPHSVFIYADCLGKWTCGTSILNQKILLTAAHCLYESGKHSRINAFAGHENIKKCIATRIYKHWKTSECYLLLMIDANEIFPYKFLMFCSSTNCCSNELFHLKFCPLKSVDFKGNLTKVKRGVQRTLIHEKYNDKGIRDDVGLLLLTDDLPLGDEIKRIVLDRQNYVGIQAAVAGWGLVNDYTKEASDRLKWTKSTIRSRSTCRRAANLAPGMMCAGSFEDECGRPSMGDSGSALVTREYHQIGIVSFRLPRHPALVIYSNISFYYDWIQFNSHALYCGRKNTATLIP